MSELLGLIDHGYINDIKTQAAVSQMDLVKLCNFRSPSQEIDINQKCHKMSPWVLFWNLFIMIHSPKYKLTDTEFFVQVIIHVEFFFDLKI